MTTPVNVCEYRARHTIDGIPAVTTIDCGQVLGQVPACQECVDRRDFEVRSVLRALRENAVPDQDQ